MFHSPYNKKYFGKFISSLISIGFLYSYYLFIYIFARSMSVCSNDSKRAVSMRFQQHIQQGSFSPSAFATGLSDGASIMTHIWVAYFGTGIKYEFFLPSEHKELLLYT